MKRWIVRSLFIGLLLLFVGAWGWSYKSRWLIAYTASTCEAVSCNWGKISLGWQDTSSVSPPGTKGWNTYLGPIHLGMARAFSNGYFGFDVNTSHETKWFIIPFWFPTAISAGLLWLVWRKTRPKAKGRAFPVELKEKQP